MESVDALFDIVKTLRGPDGCSWDRKQTPQTMVKCLEEEVYELEEAVIKNDLDNICEELGDALFQIVFITRIFQEKQLFDFKDVVACVAAKMIRRHPHVYGEARVSTHEELMEQWNAIKAEEKGPSAEKSTSVLDDLPTGLPAMARALKVSKSAVKEGFEWDSIEDVLETLKSEVAEFEAALKTENPDAVMMEFGDMLFTLVNVARFAGFHPETALGYSTAKFEGRFRQMEHRLGQRNACLKALSRDEKEQAWNQAKQDYDV